ncbi:hypothetical protein ACLK1S_00910 [Escherichia coli]
MHAETARDFLGDITCQWIQNFVTSTRFI